MRFSDSGCVRRNSGIRLPGVHAGVDDRLHRDAVRLGLVGTRIAQRRVLRSCLRRGQGGEPGIGAGGRHEHEARQHGRERQRLLALGELEAP